MLNHPEATAQALAALRRGDHFQWYLIFLLVMVLSLYFSEAAKKNTKGIAAGLSLYAIHWFYEIGNALIQHFSGHALWTAPAGSALPLLVGVGAELSLMFSVVGLVSSRLFDPDPKAKIWGINNRLFWAVGNAALASVLEIFLVQTPAFVWVYPWWGAVPVFVTTYIPFFVLSALCYDWKPRVQAAFIGGLFALDAVLLVVFAGVLRWI